MPDDLICNEDSVTCYCRPGWVDDGLPDYHVFLLRSGEEYLSAYRIESFEGDSIVGALKKIRNIMQKPPKSFRLSSDGRFIVLGVKSIVDTLCAKMNYTTKVKQVQENSTHESHVGIYVPNDREINKTAAMFLEKKIRANPQCVYPGVAEEE